MSAVQVHVGFFHYYGAHLSDISLGMQMLLLDSLVYSRIQHMSTLFPPVNKLAALSIATTAVLRNSIVTKSEGCVPRGKPLVHLVEQIESV